ncbi:uncharacterized protein LOC9644317 isoform X1 [Selaginella moellendorffii]|uniref:uncharacterized protein LOC9644317 isoform X1 n=1 Tax=Selaginella moellendorffii TaxID=88036 RepID=UPI000D1C36CF|nr:uncharacterized protein LOC9644317 isoform X1 [Selaginella moellendorffii]XP_024544865.1 uncharacterized protein LOC9644317 isoform X1 [Selaginella moellendorffii]XP_024544866.1 uncharacterized protein LOC9644317 isoform X1 [Selaginella moellendorffii]XP_024544867.1 uncharacterized protein LOC9644317 isoform X1 [Selaginella moellendorffii]XP_024544868.1 uncharacterized protein LOC9644317 isoform X1 [Selaginella moellendorffii]|eukprot:XP_024544864.1 uncharacterized protein LOC9644317 isoform X1 [Selaginella moellendorffii]
MDDALSTEHLRALAFASIPETSRRSYRWVRAAAAIDEKEEGELSSDENAQGADCMAKRKVSGNHKKKKKAAAAAQQSSASPTGVPHLPLDLKVAGAAAAQSFVYRAPASTPLQKQVTNTVSETPPEIPQKNHSIQKDKGANDLRMGTATKTLSTTGVCLPAQLPNGKANTHKASNNGLGENPFLIKFSDDESDGEDAKATPVNAAKPASLRVEIDRMKKQIAAIERVKGKSLPILKSTRPAAGSHSRQNPLGPKDCGTQTNLDLLRKQIASKEVEIQQQRQRREVVNNSTNTSSPPDSSLPASNNASFPVTDNVFSPATQQNLGTLGPSSNTGPGDSRPLAVQTMDTSTHGGGIKRGADKAMHEEEASTKRQKLPGAVENACAEVLPQSGYLEVANLSTEKRSAGGQNMSSLEIAVAGISRSKPSVAELALEEEAVDKELELAQHHRHMCEIRERLARKAYREAQEALKVATANCDKLYRRRDIISLKVTAAEMRCDVMEEGRPLELAQTCFDAPKSDSPIVPSAADQTNVSTGIVTRDDDPAPLRILEEIVSGRSVSEAKELDADAEKEIETQPACPNVPENNATSLIQTITAESAGLCTQPPVAHDAHDVSKAPPIEEKVQEAVAASTCEEEDLQGSSSSSEELRNKMDHLVVGNELETSGREPVTTLDPLEDVNGAPKQGSSTESSIGVVMDDLENTGFSVEVRDSSLNGTKWFTRLSAGRLVVFRQFTFKSAVCGIQVPEAKKAFEATAEPFGKYESPLKNSTSSKVFDPFKPLCKFEHRGKCNNELCSFQHVSHHRLGYIRDRQEASEENRNKRQASWMQFEVPVPTYRIATYLMRDWQEMNRTKFFNVSPVAPVNSLYSFLTTISMQRPLPQDMPCILDERSKLFNENFDVLQADVVNAKQMLSRESSADGCLDLALNILQYDVNIESSNCLKNALCVLSRALEMNKTSVPLWVVYLVLISMEDSMTKNDDMFLHAVRLNKYSYDLWCLVLASRTSLGDLLESYDLAILSLCEGNRLNGDGQNSACILDLVLKMFHTLAMSENDVLKWIDNLVTSEGTLNGWKSSSAVWKNLQASEACILWVCCAYFCAYGTLPGSVISRLGCKQELPLSLEWETPQVVNEGTRSRVVKMMKTATGSLAPAGSGDDLPKEVLAVNFIRFLVAFEDLEYASNYCQQAVQLHPCSVELVVLCANVQRLRGGCKSGLAVFQSALSKWPSKRSGVQALWNQYAGHALEWEGEEGALVILQKCSTREARNGQTNGLTLSTGSKSVEDSTFSLVNIALLESLRGRSHEAQVALEKALSSTHAGTHCWLEFAAFKLSATGGRNFQDVFTSILDRCHMQSRLSPKLTPLGRGFLKGIKKRRIRCFIDTLLGPAPSDYSFVNSLLRMCSGPELLPRDQPEFSRHFGGGLLELFPSNSVLALAFCKALNTSDGFSPAAAAWAGSLLVTSLRLSAAPERLWLEAGDWLQQVGLEDCCESFYRNALAAYPFSAGLWRRFISRAWNPEAAAEAAKGAGLTL